ncbi:hypothetical protein F4823DRAFT_223762 [Ustulina deusta]|nr:hypothetical protein F4823DRAFT_223762 [Ustulina deusta]
MLNRPLSQATTSSPNHRSCNSFLDINPPAKRVFHVEFELCVYIVARGRILKEIGQGHRRKGGLAIGRRAAKYPLPWRLPAAVIAPSIATLGKLDLGTNLAVVVEAAPRLALPITALLIKVDRLFAAQLFRVQKAVVVKLAGHRHLVVVTRTPAAATRAAAPPLTPGVLRGARHCRPRTLETRILSERHQGRDPAECDRLDVYGMASREPEGDVVAAYIEHQRSEIASRLEDKGWYIQQYDVGGGDWRRALVVVRKGQEEWVGEDEATRRVGLSVVFFDAVSRDESGGAGGSFWERRAESVEEEVLVRELKAALNWQHSASQFGGEHSALSGSLDASALFYSILVKCCGAPRPGVACEGDRSVVSRKASLSSFRGRLPLWHPFAVNFLRHDGGGSLEESCGRLFEC